MVSNRARRPEPLGLRERKKADTHDKILRSASALFARSGYPATSMEAIAAAADISATTLYNYFGTKGQVLLSMIARSDDELMENESSALRDANGPGAEYIAGFLKRLTRHSLKHIDRETWRYAIAHTLISENTEDIKEGYGRINARLLSYLLSMIEALRQRELIPPVEDLAALGEMIFDMYRVLFIRLIANEAMSKKAYEITLQRYVSAAIGAAVAESAS
jgi:AcrR family transcriptional regulator